MTEFALFIRDRGVKDVLDFHPDEAAARTALAAYVAERIGRALPANPDAADEEIASYFDNDHSFYAIAGLPAGMC